VERTTRSSEENQTNHKGEEKKIEKLGTVTRKNDRAASSTVGLWANRGKGSKRTVPRSEGEEEVKSDKGTNKRARIRGRGAD